MILKKKKQIFSGRAAFLDSEFNREANSFIKIGFFLFFSDITYLIGKNAPNYSYFTLINTDFSSMGN